MDFESWLTQFKKTHRMNVSDEDPQAFTQSVMERIRNEAPQLANAYVPARRPLSAWPRFALGGVCAALIAAVFLTDRIPEAPPVTFEAQAERDIKLLAEADNDAETLSWIESLLELFQAENEEIYEILPEEFLIKEIELFDEALIGGGLRG